MAIRLEHDHYAARDSEERAAQLARGSHRADRRRAERRRTRALAISALALGLVLVTGGLAALGSTRGTPDVDRAPVASQRGTQSPQQPTAREETVTPATASDAPRRTSQTRVARRPASEPKKRASAPPESESKRRVVRKAATPASAPAKKAAAKPRSTSILVRKCSAGCHPTAGLLSLRFDRASAAIVTDGMVEAQGVRLTKQERAAVIAALSRK